MFGMRNTVGTCLAASSFKNSLPGAKSHINKNITIPLVKLFFCFVALVLAFGCNSTPTSTAAPNSQYSVPALRIADYLLAQQNADGAIPDVASAARLRRCALGMEEDGVLDHSLDGFDGIFPQGYLPWVFGSHANHTKSWQWLARCARSTGALACYRGDPQYSLSVEAISQSRQPWILLCLFE